MLPELNDFYPDDLQTKARAKYNTMSGSGTARDLVEKLQKDVKLQKSDVGTHYYIAEDVDVRVGWKGDVLVSLGGEETREITNLGGIVRIYPEEGFIDVGLDKDAISHNRSASNQQMSVNDKGDFRDLRWEISRY